MKCPILFSIKNKKNITNLSSAESVHSMVSVNIEYPQDLLYCKEISRNWIGYRHIQYSAYTNSNNTLFIDVTNFSILQHRCDVIDFGQTLLYEMCVMRYLIGKTSILLQISRVFLMFRS